MSFQALAAPLVEKIQTQASTKKLLLFGLLFVSLSAIGYVLLSSKSAESLTEKDQLLLELAQMSIQLEKLKTDLSEQRSKQISSVEKRPSGKPRPKMNTIIPVAAGNAFQKVGDAKLQPYIPRGAVFQARLLTSIKTSIQGSVVVAETARPFEMDAKRRIPIRTRLIGKAVYDPTLKGVNVSFETITSPNGLQYDRLKLVALSERAWPLIEGMVLDDTGVQMGAALGFGFLSGFASGAQEREASAFGSVTKPSVKNQVLSGLSVASFQIAEQALEKMKNDALEYVVVPAGTSIYVLFNEKWEVPEGGIR